MTGSGHPVASLVNSRYTARMAYHKEGKKGYRLSRIVTRSGDKGMTGLSDGSRIRKDAPRIEVLGDIDELNCALGMILAQKLPSDIKRCLDEIQQSLFDLGAEISMPDGHRMDSKGPRRIEKQLEILNATLPPLREFIMPGGTPAMAACHLARGICRRAERHAVALDRDEGVNPEILTFLNRLSDLLFVIARSLGRSAATTEVEWQPTPPSAPTRGG